MNKNYWFQNVRVFADNKLGAPQDFFVQDGVWVASVPNDAEKIDVHGSWLLPGLFALGVDFQEPIRDDIYRLKDGFEAMRRGGFCTALCESEANPLDDLHKLKASLDAYGASGLDFHFLGAISVGHEGKSLAEMLELASHGVVGFGDGNHLPSGLRFLRFALEYAGMTGLRCYFQPMERSLAGKGHVHEGHYADTLGMKGIPAQAETIAVHQILELSGWLQVPVHLKQITCAESLNLIRNARSRGVDVTCDVSIYHLMLDESCLFALDTHTHLRPPLRTAEDKEALWKGLEDGTVQAISCAHVPVLPQDKEVNFDDAVPGAVSLEIAFVALLAASQLRFADGLERLLGWLTDGPAKICNRPMATLRMGASSPFFLFDPSVKRVLRVSDFAGQVHNSPLLDTVQTGMVTGTFFAGQWRWNR